MADFVESFSISGNDGEKYPFKPIFEMWEFYRTKPRDEQIDYVRGRLVDLARQNALSVTDLHNQPAPLPDYAGMVILGQAFSDDNKIVIAEVPDELLTYRVKIVSIDREIKKRRGFGEKLEEYIVKAKDAIRYKTGRVVDRSVSFKNGGSTHKLLSDRYNISDKYELTVALPIAWKILHQGGEFCVPCRRTTRRPKVWRYREIQPTATATAEKNADGFSSSSEPHLRGKKN